MTDRKYTPRLSIQITWEQQRKLQELIPHGVRRTIYSKFTDDLIKAVETSGQMVLGAFLVGELKAEEITGELKAVKNPNQLEINLDETR